MQFKPLDQGLRPWFLVTLRGYPTLEAGAQPHSPLSTPLFSVILGVKAVTNIVGTFSTGSPVSPEASSTDGSGLARNHLNGYESQYFFVLMPDQIRTSTPCANEPPISRFGSQPDRHQALKQHGQDAF